MARRRMFSLDVVDTDAFLDMGSGSRLLYYDLGVRADDDGFVHPMKVVRMTGASQDDLKLLIVKGFVHLFEDGVVVILHWQRNNRIDSSKYTPSLYLPRLRALRGTYVEKLSTGRPNNELPEPSKKGPQYRLGKVSTDITYKGEEAISAEDSDFEEIVKGITF